MARYLAIRAVFTLLTFWVIVTLVFFLLRLAPGGPFDGERRLPPEVEQNLRAAYNLDQPLPIQYLNYLGMLSNGDLGPSFKQKDFTVAELVAGGLPVSLAVGAAALLLALAGGISVGVWAGLHQGSSTDLLIMGSANVGLAVPAIVTAPRFEPCSRV